MLPIHFGPPTSAVRGNATPRCQTQHNTAPAANLYTCLTITLENKPTPVDKKLSLAGNITKSLQAQMISEASVLPPVNLKT